MKRIKCCIACAISIIILLLAACSALPLDTTDNNMATDNSTATDNNTTTDPVVGVGQENTLYTLENNKVYYLVNLNSRRPLEYVCGEAGDHTQLRLGLEELIGDLSANELSNADRQFRLQYDPSTDSIALRPIKNPDVQVAFCNDNHVTLEKDSANGKLTVVPYKYTIPQHNITIENVYRVMHGSSVMTYDADLNCSIMYQEITQTDPHKAAWIFYEVPASVVGGTLVTQSVE